jgi:hypothetical protein
MLFLHNRIILLLLACAFIIQTQDIAINHYTIKFTGGQEEQAEDVTWHIENKNVLGTKTYLS